MKCRSERHTTRKIKIRLFYPGIVGFPAEKTLSLTLSSQLVTLKLVDVVLDIDQLKKSPLTLEVNM